MNAIRKKKIKDSIFKTKNRRNSMMCKTIECKIDFSSLSEITKQSLFNLFLEGKWLYNSILASDNISKFNTKINEVQVKILDNFENRKLDTISAQMKQGIHTRIFSSMSTLNSLKSKGYKIGKLKFKSEIKCIPLKQHFQTFTILKKSKRIKIQGIKKPLKVSGLEQLPSNCEIANANLIKYGNDFYVKITIYIPKERTDVPDKSIGIDFGCTTQLTLSNGEKISYQIPISQRIKKLDKILAKKIKRSKNREKILFQREKEYLHITNQKKDIKNKIVNKLVKKYRTICFQDEQLNSWKQKGHGKKIQFSAIGGIISALKLKAVTPIVVEKYYPSTQICSFCGNKKKLQIKDRKYVCQVCGKEIDRDINSALNIEKEGLNKLNKIPMEYRELKPVETKTSLDNSEMNCLKVRSVKQEASLPNGQM